MLGENKKTTPQCIPIVKHNREKTIFYGCLAASRQQEITMTSCIKQM